MIVSISYCAVVRLLAATVLIVSAAVSHAEDVPPRRLLEVVDIASPTMSPDGLRVAFRVEQASVERNTYDTVWYVQALDDPLPRRVADGGVPLRDSAGRSLPAPVAWSSDGRWIYYRALIDGRIDVWRAAADGSGAAPMTLDAADVRDFSLVEGGRVLRYSVGASREAVIAAEQAEYDQGIRIDDTVPVGQGLFRSGNVEGRLATQRFGNVWFDRAALMAGTPDRWMELELATGERRALPSPDALTNATAAPGTGVVEGDPWKSEREPQGGRIALLTRVGDGTGQMYRPDIRLSMLPGTDARRAVKCVSELCTGRAITRIQWRPGHDEVLFTVTDPAQGHAQSIHRWNVETGDVLAVLRSQGLLSGGRDSSSHCGASATALVCVAAGADRPPQLERIDLETGERHVLFNPNAALGMDLTRVAPARLLRWADAKGRQFTGQFYSARRREDGPAPLFVTYYSCAGFVRGGVGDEWPLASLAQAGISALCINAFPGYTMDPLERYGQGLAAVESVIDLLAAEGEVDRARVGMGGLSFGGETTFWAVTESDVITVASIANPVASPHYYLIGSLKGEGFLAGLRDMWGLGAPSDTPERWQVLSPVFKLDRIKTPILFQHSEQEYMYALDYVIPLLRSDRADLYVFPHEPHQKFQPRHKLAAYERNVDWFRFWLQGHEDPDASKKAQYERWRQMRGSFADTSP
ncbi:Atxe2 family lasso peptide isopeptidase [Luteimonas changyuni]|uniref:Atxe2 family lasso peptide isopeptidase n=1 Tax=Luteimonas sp. MJ145 TaxID=3129234 RepID=UPI0031BB73ED